MSQSKRTPKQNGFKVEAVKVESRSPTGEDEFPKAHGLGETLNKRIDKPDVEPFNILLLGQSGAGKSTWINSFVNYIKYQSLSSAEGNAIVTIPTKLTCTDENFDTKVFYIGHQDVINECGGEVGMLSTSECREYIVQMGNKLYRFIDTPGLGGTQGVDRDKQHANHILSHILTTDYLHAILILIKSNESKLDITFKFHLQNLILQLHRDASKNILFCMTNSRNTFYKPGETISILKQCLKTMNINIELNADTIFCFDNEAFRYLCTLNQMNYRRDERACYEKSYLKSANETRRLLSVIENLPVHYVGENTNLKNLKHTALVLTDIIPEIIFDLNMTILHVTNQKKQLKSEPIYSIQLCEPLKNPRIVCAKCITRSRLPKTGMEIRKRTICKDKCNIFPSFLDEHPNQNLQKIFDQNSCPVCNCDWQTHEITLHSDNKEEREVKDRAEKESFKTSPSIKRFEKETEQIIEESVIITLFLEKNSTGKNKDLIRTKLLEIVSAVTIKPEIDILNKTIELYDTRLANARMRPNSVNEEEKMSQCMDRLTKLKYNGREFENCIKDTISSQKSVMTSKIIKIS